MAAINEVMFSASWTTCYPEVLADGRGRMTTRAGYTNVFTNPGEHLGLPWWSVGEPPSWNRFWSSYLGNPERLRSPNADNAWEHAIPWQIWDQAKLTGPGGTTARARTLVYPWAISVIVGGRVQGNWAVTELAGAVHAIATSSDWVVADTPLASRTLRGIATDLRDQAVVHLASGAGGSLAPGTAQRRTVCAPVAGSGQVSELSLAEETVRACVAGLAGLGPNGNMNDARLLEANSDPNRAARFYVLRNGLTVWHPATVLENPATNPLGCLVRNQTDLAAHIEALFGLVAWAGDHVQAGVAVPVEIQPLVRIAARRLLGLHDGARNTYRSGVAMELTRPMIDTISAVVTAL